MTSEPASVAAQPSGAPGVETDAVCRCGAGPHPELEDRCAAGHVIVGNQTALVVGQRSATFWREHAEARRELRDAVLSDAGHSEGDAPKALLLAAESLAQAVMVRDSAYLRLVESGGPLTSSARTRRAFDVWASSTDRVERHLRLVGLRRVPVRVPSLREVLRGGPERASTSRDGAARRDQAETPPTPEDAPVRSETSDATP